MSSAKKALLFANTDWYLYNFRSNLAGYLQDNGWEVVLVSPPGPFGERLRGSGFRWVPFNFSPGGLHPVSESVTIARLRRLYRKERPDLLHHFTIKCVLYGTLASRGLDGIKVVNAITGLGHVFTDTGWRARLLRLGAGRAYRYCLSRPDVRVVFQNQADLGEFVTRGFVVEGRATVIRSSGVDCDRFAPGDRVNDAKAPPKVLFASRLLREKGVTELVEAARLLADRGVRTRFVVAGSCYPGNPSSLDESEVRAWASEGLVEFLGHVDNMPPLIATSDIVALPSYREGTPRILLEAAAMERPIVATDIPGCRGVVEHGVNGLLVPPRDALALAEAIETLVLDRNLRERFGRAGRHIVLREFDERIVLTRTMELYEELLENRDVA